MSRFALTALAAALVAASPAIAQPVAITGGKLALGDGSAPIDNGVVILEDGRIVAAGPAGSVAVPAGAVMLDARGKWVSPGLVAPFSRIGLAEVDLSADGSDDASIGDSPHSAAIDVTWSVNPAASPIGVARADGVTRALVAPGPGDRIFSGQGAVIDTATDYDPITRAKAFQLVYLGEAGAGMAGGSRSGSVLELREGLRRAMGEGAYRDLPDDSLLTAADIEALVPVVKGEVPLMVVANRAVDIVNLLRLAQEYRGLDLILMGAAEGHLVADRIAAAGVPVIVEPTQNRPGSFEALAATQSNAGRMVAAGVEVAAAQINDFLTRSAQNNRQLAGNLVALTRVPGHTGVSWGQAFAMITSTPAAMVGLRGEIGVLAPGARADVVLWSGDPLELTSHAERVWIDGVEQSLENRQTALARRYRYPQREALPKAYRR
ncbi:amidohydrolase family protein [Sphingomicrobium astaxanthinifaciens]|uniref:amidohydrolase family protein n=1 Tax=Sphingomicrobium astaxanthinifaciens TaxID=1227949 RepID=UPI001FCBED9D|nr:amidohydrolase family protein [Sphingomicrobium astaxanthinifaciens]MCJ7420338.1 amidohydrolase family protein [Sphingomicrobium astaxanthinifaciens]